jgi:hypothetical protein
MTRRTIVVALVLVTVLVTGATTDASARRPAPLFVDAREWSVTLSRATVPAGRVAIQLHNAGEDDHDLRLRRLDRRGRAAGRSRRVALTHPGAMTEAVVHLTRGRWRVWCTLDGHAAAGMRAMLQAR